MIQSWQSLPSGPIVYPESDGLPMADNTKQARWIVILFGNLSVLFRTRADIFVAADLFWYPVEDDPSERIAADVLVVVGRPKGDRSSYRQWEEDNIPLTVAFEILSPSNSYVEMADKLDFYDRHGVQEYYVYDPERDRLLVYLRRTQLLTREQFGKSFTSPRLGIRFDLTESPLRVYHPDGRLFLTFEQLEEDRLREQQLRQTAEQRADRAEQRADRLAELGRKARRGQATPEELAELERLEEQPPPTSSPGIS